MNLYKPKLISGVIGAFALMVQVAVAQELEPRRWSHLPVGANFAGVGYAYTDSDIFLNPALELENVTGEVHTTIFAYVRALDVFGKSGQFSVLLPYSVGRWAGLLEGQPASTRRAGFRDPRFRLGVNLLGSPAQRGTAFRQFKVNTIVGVALEVFAPLGEYQEGRLINLGTNQWVFRPQIGAVHNWNKWSAELTGSAWFYTDNDEFDGDKTRDQEPLFSLQGHLIYTFRPGLWASFSGAYGGGAKSAIDGVEVPDRIRKYLWAVTLGLPITPLQGVKIGFVHGETLESAGNDYDQYIVAYSMMWGGK